MTIPSLKSFYSSSQWKKVLLVSGGAVSQGRYGIKRGIAYQQVISRLARIRGQFFKIGKFDFVRFF
jgi:hypothetical protein